MTTWWAVVPVKDARAGKSRLATLLDDAARADLVRRMATLTVQALVAADRVHGVVLVTPDVELAGLLRGPSVTVVPEPPHTRPGGGLDDAVRAGAAHVRATAPDASVAVVLGDLPHLRPADVDAVLDAAARHARAHVADLAGTGTTVLTATCPHLLRPAFGPGSSARHAASGHVRLDVPAESSIRHDVDRPADLRGLVEVRPR